MTLQEILKAIGLSEEQITKVLGDMKANRIFTTGEENLDTRYSKLKSDHDGTEKQLKEANELIEQLKKGTGDNEALQGRISEYENRVAVLEQENAKLKVEGALKVALLDAGAKASDIDYLMFKAGNGGKELKVTEDGRLKGEEELIAGLKTQFPGNFAAKEEREIQEHRLESGDVGNENSEPKTLSEALRMQFENKE